MRAICRRASGFVTLTAGFVLLLGGSVAWSDDHIPTPPDPVRCVASDCEADSDGDSGNKNSDSEGSDSDSPNTSDSSKGSDQQESEPPSEGSERSEHESETTTSDASADGSGAAEPSPTSEGTERRSSPRAGGARNPEAARAAQAQEQSASVDIGDDFFDPRELTIEVGTTVTWTNNGQNPHTVSADDGSFESGADQADWLQPGQTFSFTFDEAGSFPYYCRLHGGPGGVGHAGVITVTSADDDSDGGDGQGSVRDGDSGGSGSDAGAQGGGSGSEVSASGGSDANGSGAGGLALTGGSYSALAGAGIALIVLGGALLFVLRPRPRVNTEPAAG